MLKRILHDIRCLKECGCNVKVEDDHPYTVQFDVTGPLDSIYETGKWKIVLEFPKEYPYKPPTVTFKTRIHHPNIYKGDMTVLEPNVCFHMIAVMQFGDWGVEASEAIRVTNTGSELFCNFPKELKIK